MELVSFHLKDYKFWYHRLRICDKVKFKSEKKKTIYQNFYLLGTFWLDIFSGYMLDIFGGNVRYFLSVTIEKFLHSRLFFYITNSVRT